MATLVRKIEVTFQDGEMMNGFGRFFEHRDAALSIETPADVLEAVFHLDGGL